MQIPSRIVLVLLIFGTALAGWYHVAHRYPDDRRTIYHSGMVTSPLLEVEVDGMYGAHQIGLIPSETLRGRYREIMDSIKINHGATGGDFRINQSGGGTSCQTFFPTSIHVGTVIGNDGAHLRISLPPALASLGYEIFVLKNPAQKF